MGPGVSGSTELHVESPPCIGVETDSMSITGAHQPMTDPHEQMERTQPPASESGPEAAGAAPQSTKSSRGKKILLICLWLVCALLVLDWIWLRIIFSVPLPTVDKVPI